MNEVTVNWPNDQSGEVQLTVKSIARPGGNVTGVISLNSEMDVSASSTQVQWLREQLSTSSARCTAVYWHRPLFSSGPNGFNGDMRDVWRVLYDNGRLLTMDAEDVVAKRDAVRVKLRA